MIHEVLCSNVFPQDVAYVSHNEYIGHMAPPSKTQQNHGIAHH